MRAQFLILFIFFSFAVRSGRSLEEEDGVDYYDDCGDELELDFVAMGKQVTTSKKKTYSPLSIVYNRLAHLTRITSAISLQAAAIRKSVKVRNVVTELLRAPPDHLKSLIQISPDEIIWELRERFDASREVLKVQDQMSILSTKNGILELMNSSISYLNGQQIDHEKMSEFFESLRNGTFLNTAVACDAQILTPVIEFSEDENPDHLKFDALKSKTPEIKSCLKSLDSYKTKISVLQDQFHQFLKLGEAKEGIQNFNKLRDEAMEYGQTIKQVMAVFEKTRKFWAFSSKIGSTVSSTIHNMKEILNPENSPELSLTLGFPEPGDMAKVSKDLKSRWFRKKVARGHSVKELATELVGFFKFGEKMKTLEEDWTEVKESFARSETKMFHLAKILKKLDEFKIGAAGLKIAKESDQIFGNTWANFDQIKAQDFKDLDRILSRVGSLIESLNSIRNHVDEIQEQTEKVKISVFLDDLQTENSVEKLSNLQSFKELGARFSKLKASQEKLSNQIGRVGSQADVGRLIATLRDSKLKSNLENLRSNKQFQPEIVLKMFQFSRLVLNIAHSKAELEQTRDFLQNVNRMKGQLKVVEDFVKGIKFNYQESHKNEEKKDHENPILMLENSQEMALSLGRGMRVLRQMVKTLHARRRLRKVSEYSDDVDSKILNFNPEQSVKEFWKTKNESIGQLLGELRILNQYAKQVQYSSPMEMRKVLEEATKVHGFSNVFKPIAKQFSDGNLFPKQTENFKRLAELDLNFAAHKGYLHAASLSFDELKTYFDEVFDLAHKRHSHHEIEHNHLPAILICLSIFLLIIVCLAIAYGFIPSGRRKYVNLYLYYFGKPEAFEKRWRYSLFMDRQDGKNSLLDAAREINPTNLKKALRKGAYINAFNKFGNTSLHLATKRGHPEIVEILIRNGADRELLNAYNKTPERMIPENYRETHQEKIGRFKRIEQIYEKYRKKKFRHRVPNEFPVTSYHIYIEDHADDKVTDNFTLKFQSITTDEATNTTTHFVVRTEKDGVFVTESLELILWVLSGTIIMKDSWMLACLNNEKELSNDWNYLVEKIRYRGVVYDTVPQWQQTMAKSTLPYLCGVYVAVVIKEYSNLLALASIVTNHGGMMCEKFPEKQNFNIGFRPSLHADTGPFFIIHDGQLDLDVYKNDPDGMYTLMTEAEFVHFMLGRKIKRNKSLNPIPALNDLDD